MERHNSTEDSISYSKVYTKPISFHYLFSINRRNHIHINRVSKSKDKINLRDFERDSPHIFASAIAFPCIHNESICDFEPSIDIRYSLYRLNIFYRNRFSVKMELTWRICSECTKRSYILFIFTKDVFDLYEGLISKGLLIFDCL